jgi:hypothetical protein
VLWQADERAAPVTKRSVTIGLLCALLISGLGYFHDCVINADAYIMLVPHLMPHAVYGGLLLLVGLNPLLRRLRWQPLAGRELAVITGLSLLACSVPFYGLVHCWPSALMFPHHSYRLSPGWQREQILDLVPSFMLADVNSERGADALTGYVAGMSRGQGHIAWREVPWDIWIKPLAFWVPLVLSISVATLALAVVVNRQWSRHEQLPYPIAKFTALLFPDHPECVLRKRSFRVGLGLVLGIHMVNYFQAWWPDILVPVRLALDFRALVPLFEPVTYGDGWALFTPRVMFTVIGIAYFFASDVSLSLAITPYVVCYVVGVLSSYGFQVTRGFSMFNNATVFVYAGAYLGIVLMVLYTGRYFYGNLLRQGLALPCQERAEPHLVWSMRAFLLFTALFYILLCYTGVDWLLSLYYTLMALVVFIAVSRAVAEAGGFYIGTWIMPGAVAWGLLGSQALGPTALATMVMVSIIVLVGPGWAPMAFGVQALKLAELGNVRPGRMGALCIGVLVLCVAVALPATIYWQHDQGLVQASSGWARYTPRLPFDQGLIMKEQLTAVGVLDQAEAVRGLGRLALAKPSGAFVTAFAIGLGLTLLTASLRLRFPWWPLHPLAFFFLNSHQGQRVAFSLLIGWAIKTAICRYGGEMLYQKGKPLMAGVIAGEMLAGTLPILVGAVYYVTTGERPVNSSLVY